MKKKILVLLLALVLVLTACGGGDKASTSTPASESQAESSAPASESQAETSQPTTGEKKKVALLTDVAGTQVFILSMIDGLNAAAAKHNFEARVVECQDATAYQENARALVNEGYDLIIGGGWQAGEAISLIATEFPDAADYALVDSEVAEENVKCIAFREQEGAYLIGLIASKVVPEDAKQFGMVHVNPGPGSWKWRWAFQEAVKTQIPDAKFVENFVGDYNDPAKAKEFALLQAEQGAAFINAAAAGGDAGVFEAALEKHFYTSGQDVDLTSPDNPWIVSSQMKDTKATMEVLLDQYYSDSWNTENEQWGIAEGAIGAVYITHDSPNPRSPELSDDEVAFIKGEMEKIKSGELNLKVVPAEEEYKK